MYDRRYHAKVLKHNDKPSKKKRFRWKRWAIVIGFVAVVVGITFLIRVPEFQVSTINVVGTNVTEPADISQFVLGKLEGVKLWVLPRTSIFLVSTKDVTAALTKQYPRFKSVKVTRTNMHTLKVTVSEYPAVYLWCDADKKCSFMDETGTVFADAPYFSGSAYLKIYSGTRAPYPFHPVTPDQLALITTIKDRLQTIGITPLSFSFVSDHNLVVEFAHTTNHPTIMFDPTLDIDTQLQTLYSGLKTEPLIDLYNNPKKVLLYLDMRFADKLVYKFQ